MTRVYRIARIVALVISFGIGWTVAKIILHHIS